jgi:hypothetical protein
MKSKKTEDDGIYLSKHKGRELDIALISLKIGFEAYYSTYQSVKRFLNIVETRPNKIGDVDESYGSDQKFFENMHISNYAKAEVNFTQAYIETIFHFHHFIEVSIKEILRQEHELLASEPGRKQHVILHKLLFTDEVTDEEKGSLRSLPFGEATERITELIKAKRIKNHKNMEFISEEENFMKEIATFRNRLVHRGTFVLRYTDLDIFVGKHIFPFVLKLLSLPIYKNSKFKWQPEQLHCQLDPMQEIIKECKVPKPDFSKISFLKEMERAAYNNPLMPKQKMRRDGMKEAMEERAIKEESNNDEIIDIKNCPICGANTLIRYRNMNLEDEREEVETLKCICCSFEIDSELSKVNFEGLDTKKYWK